MLVRSWNLFHGNTYPPRHESYLEEMVRLASADRPDVLLLQEVPAWARGRLGKWSGMTAVADPVRGPRLPSGIARSVTALNSGLLRSLLTGQANAILLAPTLEVVTHEVLVLNRGRLPGVGAHERRICQIVRLPALVVANLHASQSPAAARAEIERAAAAVEREARQVVLGGDFNLAGEQAALEGFSRPGPGIDHILVRGAEPSPLRTWPDEQRTRGGMLLSDHSPVELDL